MKRRPLILSHGGAARPNIAGRIGDGGVLGDYIDNRLLPRRHVLWRGVLRRFGDAGDQAGVLLGKEPLLDRDEQKAGQCDRREHRHQRGEAAPDCDFQTEFIDALQRCKTSFETARDNSWLALECAGRRWAHSIGVSVSDIEGRNRNGDAGEADFRRALHGRIQRAAARPRYGA